MYSDFGSMLRNARMRRGYDINTVARRLRIRPDVIQSIERADFEAMPPRGYARKMIGSYARLVGLDPDELTRRYLDALRDYQAGRSGAPAPYAGRSAGYGSQAARGNADRRRADRTRSQRNTRSPRTGAEPGGRPRGGSTHGTARQGRGTPATLGNGALFAAGHGPSGSAASFVGDLRNRLPFMGVAILVIVLVIILLVLLFGPKGSDSQEVANMPVTGVESATVTTVAEDSSSGDDDSSSSSSETEPTSFTFSYEVADGTTVWIDCTVDGQTRVSQSVTGPTKQEFTVSKSVTFSAGASDGVTIKQGDDEVKLKSNGSGGYTRTLKFSSYLKKWREAHNISTSDSSSSSSDSSTSSSSDSSSTSTDDTESSSTGVSSSSE